MSQQNTQNETKSQPQKPLTLVLKIGSSSISSSLFSSNITNKNSFNLSTLSLLIETICMLRAMGHRVVLVSSGAVSIGCKRMKIEKRPENIVTKQAVAAIGQGRLMRLYDDLFSLSDQPIAQVLLTRQNIAKGQHQRNALNTFNELLEMGVVPIVNENDTVAIAELKFGDNDKLSALVATLIKADYLFLLTDIDALYTSNPRKSESAQKIPFVKDIEQIKELLKQAQIELNNESTEEKKTSMNNNSAMNIPSSSNVDANNSAMNIPSSSNVDAKADSTVRSGSWGVGGMLTKLQAAEIAVNAGCHTVIMHANQNHRILSFVQQHSSQSFVHPTVTIGTHFLPQINPHAQGHDE